MHHIARALESAGVVVERMGGLQRPRVLINKALNKIQELAWPGSLHPVERTMNVAEHMAREIRTRLMNSRCDVVFSPGSIPLALLDTNRPKAFYTDATFSGILELYPEYRRYSKRYLKEGHDLEQAALTNCDGIYYSSQWAAESAIDRYKADRRKIKVIPFGSNFEAVPSEREAMTMARERSKSRIELLFLAVNWERKGGQRVMDIARALNKRGLDIRLRIVGVEPPGEAVPDYVEVHPFISKNTASGQRKLAGMIATSHLLLLPTVADCTPIVFCEANSFAVPCFTNNVGGVPSVVHDGVNGRLFDLKAPATAWADAIEQLLVDRKKYQVLAERSREEYQDRLNWETTGKRLRACLEGLL